MQTEFFTVEDGLAVQRADLQRWKSKLAHSAYQMVLDEAIRRNSELRDDTTGKTGYDVWRGGMITEYILNLP